MPKNTLIATLGTSPAVITEAVDLLTEAGTRPDQVLLLMTQDTEVQESYALLVQHLPAHDGITHIEPVTVASYEDITDSESAVEFLQIACTLLKTHRDVGDRLFVSIAGGRKVMSALLALAVQFYGAERLFHIWVPPWIEEQGEIHNLRHRPEEWVTERLHPPLTGVPEGERPRLVDLPFIGLFPLLGDILNALRGETPPSRDLKATLVTTGLLTPQGELTPLGQRILPILEGVESLPPARQEECRIHVSSHRFRDRLDRFAAELEGKCPFVTEIQSDEWRQGEERVWSEPPNVVIVGQRLGTDICFRLRLVTTATSSGQLEAAKKYVEGTLLRKRG